MGVRDGFREGVKVGIILRKSVGLLLEVKSEQNGLVGATLPQI